MSLVLATKGMLRERPVIKIVEEVVLTLSIISEVGPQIEDNKVEMKRGDSKTIKVVATAPNGSIIDLTGSSIIFSLKKLIDDAAVVVVKTTADSSEIDIINPIGGIAHIFLLPADTQNEIGRHIYDIQITLASGEVITPLVETLDIKKDVTRP